jgi:iron complex transport system substrate-binding protein
MKNNTFRVFLSLIFGLSLLMTACTAKVTPTQKVASVSPTIKATEKQPSTTATKTVRVRASNTPLGGRAPSRAATQEATSVGTDALPAPAPTTIGGQTATSSPLPGQSKTATLTRTLPAGATPGHPTQTPLPTETLEFSETPTPTGPTPTPTITLTPTPLFNNGPIDLQDGLGRMVHLPGPAVKVVSLSPAGTEILFGIGAWFQVVGRDVFSDYPEEALPLPDVGGDNGNFDQAAISNLHPDLVLLTGFNNPALVTTLEGRGLTVFYLANPTNMEESYENLRKVAKLTSHEQETDRLITSFHERLTWLAGKISAVTSHPKVLIELDGTDPANPWTCGPGSYLDTMITLAGGQNIGLILASPWGQMSTAQIVSANPDIIILADAFYGTTPDDVIMRPGWSGIRAVRDDAIYSVDDYPLSRPGIRLNDGLEMLAEKIHPEIYQ